MEREERYYVIKKSDLEAALKVKRITQTDVEDLKELLVRLRIQRFISDKEALECVVVEKDWPEYEPVWKAIEQRVNGPQPLPQMNKDVLSLADSISKAVLADEISEGCDISAGIFGPAFSQLLHQIVQMQKKAEAYDKIQYCEGCGQTRDNYRDCMRELPDGE